MKGWTWLLLYLQGFNPLVLQLRHLRDGQGRFAGLRQLMQPGSEILEMHLCSYWVEAGTYSRQPMVRLR